MPFKTGLAEKRWKVLEKELERLLPKIVELDVEKVILIGSMLGKVYKSSDIDIIVLTLSPHPKSVGFLFRRSLVSGAPLFASGGQTHYPSLDSGLL